MPHSPEAYKRWYEKNKEKIRKQKREVMQSLRAKEPEKYRIQSRQSKERLKERVFDKYGRECVRCGFTDVRALTLDHVLNNGSAERQEHGERGVYRRALQDEYTAEYQTLCMNCQFIKRVEAGKQNQHQQWCASHGIPFTNASTTAEHG